LQSESTVLRGQIKSRLSETRRDHGEISAVRLDFLLLNLAKHRGDVTTIDANERE
jgi:hypothetical protein